MTDFDVTVGATPIAPAAGPARFALDQPVALKFLPDGVAAAHERGVIHRDLKPATRPR